MFSLAKINSSGLLDRKQFTTGHSTTLICLSLRHNSLRSDDVAAESWSKKVLSCREGSLKASSLRSAHAVHMVHNPVPI